MGWLVGLWLVDGFLVWFDYSLGCFWFEGGEGL